MLPPRTAVTALVGVPGLPVTPPQGAIFCGSPSWFSTRADAGASSWKWADAPTGRNRTAAATAESMYRFIGGSPDSEWRNGVLPVPAGLPSLVLPGERLVQQGLQAAGVQAPLRILVRSVGEAFRGRPGAAVEVELAAGPLGVG